MHRLRTNRPRRVLVRNTFTGRRAEHVGRRVGLRCDARRRRMAERRERMHTVDLRGSVFHQWSTHVVRAPRPGMRPTGKAQPASAEASARSRRSSWLRRCPANEGGRARISGIFERGATPPGGMQRRSNAAGLSLRAVRARRASRSSSSTLTARQMSRHLDAQRVECGQRRILKRPH